jgi:hypothetical protein
VKQEIDLNVTPSYARLFSGALFPPRPLGGLRENAGFLCFLALAGFGTGVNLCRKKTEIFIYGLGNAGRCCLNRTYQHA